jgi:hypothetical protein
VGVRGRIMKTCSFLPRIGDLFGLGAVQQIRIALVRSRLAGEQVARVLGIIDLPKFGTRQQQRIAGPRESQLARAFAKLRRLSRSFVDRANTG